MCHGAVMRPYETNCDVSCLCQLIILAKIVYDEWLHDPLLFKTCMAKHDIACSCDGIFVPGQVDPVCVGLWLMVGCADGSTWTRLAAGAGTRLAAGTGTRLAAFCLKQQKPKTSILAVYCAIWSFTSTDIFMFGCPFSWKMWGTSEEE